ncbi:MAG: hypothetical protein IJV60_02570 [Prevotella sp.]|nr:hypothetical protein [Prevotella sp.]MBQ8058311.1 hypothetical protein [Prevotella sp.]
MNKIYNICKSLAAVAITTAMVCSCDSTANEIKVEAVNGHYNGTVIVGLYVPDLVIEAENTFITDGETIGICADTVNTTIGMEFYNNNQVKISVDKLSNIEFNIPFLDVDGNVRDIYSDGYLAYLYNMTRQLLDRGVITQEEFSQFYEQIDTLHDRMTVSGITTNLMPMVEQGAMLASYDYEQNSYYTQFNLSEFTYQRTAEVLKPFEYMKQLLIDKGIESEEMQRLDEQIHNAVPVSGTVKDGWGWCTIGYSNYQSYIDMHLERATGMLDVLSIALFGMARDEEGNVVYDSNGRPKANKPMWFVVWYNGQIEDTGIYKRLSD